MGNGCVEGSTVGNKNVCLVRTAAVDEDALLFCFRIFFIWAQAPVIYVMGYVSVKCYFSLALGLDMEHLATIDPTPPSKLTNLHVVCLICTKSFKKFNLQEVTQNDEHP